MKITNETKWTTSHLRAIAAIVARMVLDRETAKRLRVIFRSRRSAAWYGSKARGSSGWAGCRTISVTLPTIELIDSDRIDFCATLAHEMKHVNDWVDPNSRRSGRTGGRKWERSHRRSIPYGRPKTEEGKAAQRELYGWVLSMPIEPKPAKVRKQVDHVAKRADKAAADLKRWQAKLKLAQTKVRKLRGRVKYYERRQSTALTIGEVLDTAASVAAMPAAGGES